MVTGCRLVSIRFITWKFVTRGFGRTRSAPMIDAASGEPLNTEEPRCDARQRSGKFDKTISHATLREQSGVSERPAPTLGLEAFSQLRLTHPDCHDPLKRERGAADLAATPLHFST
jgi:hypothetical protein